MRGGGADDASRGPSRWDRPLAGVAAAIAIAAPLLVGGVHPTTQIVLSLATLALTATHVALRGRHGILLPPFSAMLGLGALFTLVQLVPLPAPLVHLLSPAAWELRAALGAGSWMPLTLDVPATALALVRSCACLGLFLVVASAGRSRRGGRRLLFALTLLGGGFALLAFVERGLGAEAILWVYQPRSQPGFGFFGTFVDVNHAASLLSLTALIAIGLVVELDGPRRMVALVCAALAVSALLFTTSRGGLIGFAVGGLLLAMVLLGRSLGRVRGLISAAVLLLVAISVVLWAGEGLRARFVPSSTSQLWQNQKTRGWRDGLAMSRDFAWTGVGRGAFEAPLRAYRHETESVRLVYPENVLVQYVSEWGWPMTLVLLALGIGGLRRVRRGLSELPAGIVGAAAGVAAVGVHELMDFGTELLGVALPATLALALVAGRTLARETKEETPTPKRLARARSVPALVAWTAACALAMWAAGQTIDDDDVALHAAVQAHQPSEAALAAAQARHPADDYLELLAAEDGLRRHDPHAMHHLNRALQLHPANWQAHQLAARLLANVGRPRQAALEYRSALQYGMLPDYHELSRVLGRAVVDAVAQEPEALVGLARQLCNIGRVDDGIAACSRAADVAPTREGPLGECAQAAIELNLAPLALAVGRLLAAAATTASSFARAGQALALAHEPKEAFVAVDRGLAQHPADAGLVLATAKLRLDAGELGGARALLSGRADASWSLAERQRAEELLGDVAEHAGDAQAALLARARARMLARRIKETSFNRGPGDDRP